MLPLWSQLKPILLLTVAVTLYGVGFGLGAKQANQQAALRWLKAENQWQQQLLKAEQQNRVLVAAFKQAKARTQIEYRTLKEQVPHVVKEFVAVDGGRCRFDAGFVGLWNHALFTGLPAAADGAADAAAVTAAADPATAAYPDDLLANHIDNAERCVMVRQQLAALIQWHQQREPM